MLKTPQVTILMATYNGEKFIAQQLDSIIAQSYTEWRLLISDDGSTDNTRSILQQYHQRMPEKISILDNTCRCGSARDNFFRLMRDCNDEFVMLCDQDDIWESSKVHESMDVMLRLQEDSEPNAPLLVFTDLAVTDADLKIVSPSFLGFSGINGKRTSFHQLLVQNVVTGCTVMLNKQLVRLALEFNCAENICMHDWWIALTASAFGHICFLNKATVRYRQHGRNSVGAKNVRSIRYILNKSLLNNDIRKSMVATTLQAKEFLSSFSERLSPETKKLLTGYAGLYSLGKIKRIFFMIKHRTLKYGVYRKFAQIIWG